jgi:hypothetical protein
MKIHLVYSGTLIAMKTPDHGKGMEFWSWGIGIGHREDVTKPHVQYPSDGALSLYRHLGIEFPVAFNEQLVNSESTICCSGLMFQMSQQSMNSLGT